MSSCNAVMRRILSGYCFSTNLSAADSNSKILNLASETSFISFCARATRLVARGRLSLSLLDYPESRSTYVMPSLARPFREIVGGSGSGCGVSPFKDERTTRTASATKHDLLFISEPPPSLPPNDTVAYMLSVHAPSLPFPLPPLPPSLTLKWLRLSTTRRDGGRA